MKSRYNKLLFKQIAKKLEPYMALQKETVPANGWVAAVRLALGMSMSQLGKKMGKSPQAVNEIQNREKNGSITLNSLREIAGVMHMKVVYAIIPDNVQSLEDYIRKRAEEKAKEIVLRTNNTMILESQEIGEQRKKESINELTEEFLEKPSELWD